MPEAATAGGPLVWRRVSRAVRSARALARRRVEERGLDDLEVRVRRRRSRQRAYRENPPKPPPGTVTAPPDFVGIGFQRCGTTWAHRQLSQHPEVYRVPDRPKELHFFSNLKGPVTPDIVARYHRCFPRPPGMKAGEWTPDYIFSEEFVAALVACAPGARFLVMVRDPAERYRSESHRRQAFGLLADGPIRMGSRGEYHRQLTAALRHIPREQLLIQQFEQVRADEGAAVAALYAFVGLDPDFRPERMHEPAGASMGGKKIDLAADERRFLARAYADDMEALGCDFPEIDLSLWPTWNLLHG